jgi:hypothetical protein
MRELRYCGSALAVVVVGSALASASAFASTARITYSDSFTTPVPGMPSGRVLRELFTNVNDPPNKAANDPTNGKPPAVSHVHAQLPAGARFDTSAVPQCTASDAALMLQGPSACPPATKLGTDDFVIDEEEPPTTDRYVLEQVTYFNEKDGLILLAHDPTGAYIAVHGKIGADTLDIELPPFPGTPPDGGATKSENSLTYAVTGKRNGRTVGYITTPPRCPASEKWLFHMTFTYRGDGTKQTVESAMPCIDVPPSAQRSALHVAFYRHQSARAGSPVRVRVMASRAAAGKATILSHGKAVVSRKVVLHTGINTVRLPAVQSGSYRFRLSAHVPGESVSRSARLVVR